MKLGGWLRFLAACAVCGPALLLPYRARLLYAQCVAGIVHAPSILFGRLARFLLRQLNVENPYPRYTRR